MRLEVRCCCYPAKLLGWMDVPDTILDGHPSVSFLVRTKKWMFTAEESKCYVPIDIITLPLAKVASASDWRGYWALKSEETPIERLRLIREFTENSDEPHSHGS